MERISRALPAISAAERAADGVIRRLNAAGFSAYRVGGAVRDRLLGRTPKDVDVATEAAPEQVQALFSKTVAVGARFGVIVVLSPDGPGVEVASFRRDGSYRDGRRPESVAPASLEGDSRRRDFTVNALYYSPSTAEILDFHGGMRDLERGLLRAVGEAAARFREDALRLLRAVRFAAEFGFRIAPETAEAIRREARGLRRISSERIRDELTRMLLGADPVRAFSWLGRFGLLAECLPEVPAPDAERAGKGKQNPVLARLGRLRAASPRLAWAALLLDAAEPRASRAAAENGTVRERAQVSAAASARGVLERLRSSRALREGVAEIIRNQAELARARTLGRAALRRMAARPAFADELELHRIARMASGGSLEPYCFLLDFLGEQAGGPALPPPLLRGRDLIALGFSPGPQIGRLLREIETRRLAGELKTRAHALKWLQRRRHGFDPEP